jgi:hypothetical protein
MIRFTRHPGRALLTTLLLVVLGSNLLKALQLVAAAAEQRRHCQDYQRRLTEALRAVPDAPSPFDTQLILSLRRSGYLRTVPLDIGTAPESALYYHRTGSNFACKVHGSTEVPR